MPTSFNVWTPKGVVENTPATGAGQPAVLFEGNAKILSGNVFKMWYTNFAAPGINYAESSDGVTWSQYSSNPVLAVQGLPKIFKNGSTYYLYTSTSNTTGPINVYTSTDGLSWISVNAGAITPGTGWEATGVFQLSVLDNVAGTWYGYYTGAPSFYMGLATSTDLVHWTKSGSNPIISVVTSNFTFAKVGSTYYGWSQAQAPGRPSGTYQNIISRFSATNPSGPWTQLMYNGVPVATYYAAVPADLYSSQLPQNSQVGDPCILEDGSGNTWMFFSLGHNNTASFNINAAEAVGKTIAQLVQTYEGVVGAPFPGALALNLVTQGNDPGTGTNANPIGGNWTTNTQYHAIQRNSNLIEPAFAVAGSAAGISYWNAYSWAADQWAQATVATLVSGSTAVGVVTRMTPTAKTLYYGNWVGATGSSGTWSLTKVVTGTSTVLQTGSITMNIGDTLTLVNNGTNLILYWDNATTHMILAIASDSDMASGDAGIYMQGDLISTSDAAASSWSGGSFQAAPPIVTSAPASWFLDQNISFDASIKKHKGF